MPARLLRDIDGRSVADLCAAPGGKTAQLALQGANVTAIDRSEIRMSRLRENLRRLGLESTTKVAAAEEWPEANGAGPFDAVLVDAPCTATGNIRRHPDIAWLKSPAELELLTALQRRLLAHAPSISVGPAVRSMFATCSLEPEEGEDIVATLLDHDARKFAGDPIAELGTPRTRRIGQPARRVALLSLPLAGP